MPKDESRETDGFPHELLLGENVNGIREQDPDFRDAIDVTQLSRGALFPLFGPMTYGRAKPERMPETD